MIQPHLTMIGKKKKVLRFGSSQFEQAMFCGSHALFEMSVATQFGTESGQRLACILYMSNRYEEGLTRIRGPPANLSESSPRIFRRQSQGPKLSESERSDAGLQRPS